jgi:hypothetical protein
MRIVESDEPSAGADEQNHRGWMKTYRSSGPYPFGAGPGPGPGSWNRKPRYPARSFQPGFSKPLSWPSTTWCGQALSFIVSSSSMDIELKGFNYVT